MSSPSSSPRQAAHRPQAIKRTYGSRGKQAKSASWMSAPSSSTTTSIFSSTPLRASSPPSMVYGRTSSPVVDSSSSTGFRLQTPEVDEEEDAFAKVVGDDVGDEARVGVGKENDTSGGLGRKVSKGNTKDNRTLGSGSTPAIKSQKSQSSSTITKNSKIPSSTAAPTQATLKSFFTFQTQPKPTKPTYLTSSNLRIESSTTVIETSTKPTSTNLHQLHLVPVHHPTTNTLHTTTSRSSLLTTCAACNMSYIRGGIGAQDDSTHREHCSRVTEGVKWDSRSVGGGSVTMTGRKLASWRKGGRKSGGQGIVLRDVAFGQQVVGKGKAREKAVGSVVCVDGYEAASDKRVMEILDSVDTVLSAPALPEYILSRCKIFLFTTSSQAPSSPTKRQKVSSSSTQGGKPVERVVGCVVVQPIRSGMRVLQDEELREVHHVGGKRKRDELVVIGEDAEDPVLGKVGGAGLSTKAVICSPSRLPCKIGIHRIFTVPRYRGLGISKILLDVACEKTIYGYTCVPADGDVAFSQPTSSGKALMDAWGGGNVRVFVEDEQQSDGEE